MILRYICLTLLLIVFVSAEADSDVRRDPFLQPDLTAIKTSAQQSPTIVNRGTLLLKGTLRSGDNVLANINGNILAIGDELDGFKLISVSEQSATLENSSEKLELLLDNYTNNGREQ